jgi:hypothetical protein
MSKKIMMLALAAVSAALFAMPAVASAGEWDADGAAGQTFSVTKITNPELRAGETTVKCTGLTGSGTYTTDTTGNITLDFTGCTDGTFGTACTSTGAASGTIAVTNKQFHNVIIGNAGDNKTPLGVLITGNSGATTDFTTFSCGFGLVTVTVTGSIIGEVEPVECNKAASTFNLNFQPTVAGGSIQKYQQVTTEGTKFDLLSDIPSGGDSTTTSAQSGTGQIHFPKAVTPTCS